MGMSLQARPEENCLLLGNIHFPYEEGTKAGQMGNSRANHLNFCLV